MRTDQQSPPSAGTDARLGAAPAPATRKPIEIAAEVATVLAGMSYPERVRAYRSGALSAHELALAAGWFGEEMPKLNGEYEWIAISLVDNE